VLIRNPKAAQIKRNIIYCSATSATNLEVFDSLHFQFQRCVLVTYHQRVGMLLKCTHRPHMINVFLDSFVQCK